MILILLFAVVYSHFPRPQINLNGDFKSSSHMKRNTLSMQESSNIVKSKLEIFLSGAKRSISESLTNTPIPNFSPFFWNQTILGIPLTYSINGTICVNILVQGQPLPRGPCESVSLAIDPANQRYMYDLGYSGGGQFYYLADSFYNSGDGLIPNGACANAYTGANYTQQILGYGMVTSLPGSTTNYAQYSGVGQDIGACLYVSGLVGSYFIQQFGIPTLWKYDQPFNLPFGENGAWICTDAEAIITFDPRTLNFDPVKVNKYFTQMPADCTPATPYSYCTAFYSSNVTMNPCSQRNTILTF